MKNLQEPIPPPPKKGILTFGTKPKQPEMPDLSGISDDMNSLSRRMRLMEESVTNLRRIYQITEENIISKNKYYAAELKTFNSEISEIKKEIHEIKEKFMKVIMELQMVARKEDVKVLEKYIGLWNPVKFVTQAEVERIVDEILEKKRQ